MKRENPGIVHPGLPVLLVNRPLSAKKPQPLNSQALIST